MRKFIIILLFSALWLVHGVAYSDIYRYTDESGVVCYTDAPFGKKSERVLKEKPSVLEKQPELITTKQLSSTDYSSYVQKAASKYEIDSELINAVIKTESNGNHRAVSRKGAMGLMQLMPTTANDMNVSNPFNPEENIDGGTKYLRAMLEKFDGDLTLALAAYNAGPKKVEKYRSVPPISETRNYVKKVYSLYKGKQNYSKPSAAAPSVVKDTPPAAPRPAPIYKVLLDDGTVLFTNSTLQKPNKIRF
ncbi:MAG: lytic transglycosylase domain-containing protein [Nitrospirae bacterium]|nr:lytic transglycosylase domain-containing protein [Nitrospirota bacterium]